MSRNEHIHLFPKYAVVHNWLQEITFTDSYKAIIESAKDCAKKKTGCTQAEIDEIAKFGFNSLIYEPRFQPIVDSYFDCLDNIRKVRQ